MSTQYAKNCYQAPKEAYNELKKHLSEGYYLINRNTEDLWATFTNLIANGTVNITLPPAVVGDGFSFRVSVAHDLEITAYDSETIENPNTGSQINNAIVSNEIGSTIQYVCTTEGEWECIKSTGTWTI